MAAPLGFKTFNTGDVLSAADTNGYLMQGIWVFANATARDAAVTSPQEGNSCYLKDTDVIQVYSGSSWVVKSGGSSPLTTKGDLYTYSTTDARLPVGANGTTLVADSAEATGLKWALPAGGAGNMAQIASGSWNAVGTVTLTGLSSYSEIVIVNYAQRPDVAGQFKMTLNGVTTSNYTFVGYRASPAAGTSGNQVFINDTLFYLSYDNMSTANASTAFSIKLTNCKSTGFTDIDLIAGFHNTAGGNSFAGKGVFTKSETISSLSMFITGTTFNNGDYVVWGA